VGLSVQVFITERPGCDVLLGAVMRDSQAFSHPHSALADFDQITQIQRHDWQTNFLDVIWLRWRL